VATSTSQDAAVDVKRGRYYVSGNDPHRMVIVSAKDPNVIGEVPVPANTDLIGYDPVTGMVYESNDTAAEVWVIDPNAKKIVTTIKYQGKGVEELAFDAQYRHLFQAIKGSNSIAVVDPATNQVLNAWPLAPDTGPHGIALVGSDGLLAACAGKLVLINRSTGKILDRADIPQKVDEIAYDPDTHLAYCASKLGEIAVVRVAGDKLAALSSVPNEKGSGSITVDPKTHTVWVAYDKGGQSFVQPFTPAE
jgi:DNA-binding beta-propeller fold protein YncE